MLFPVGKISWSKGVLTNQHISSDDLVCGFGRYIRGDWGNLGPEESLANDLAIANGERIVAMYTSSFGKKFCMVTHEGETRVILPEEHDGFIALKERSLPNV